MSDPSQATDSADLELDELNNLELAEIAKNIRVEGPDGPLTLDAIILDLAASHNEVEQTKQGALTLVNALDERIEEEKEHNPESPEVEALEQVRESAWGLYLRIQRGDEELSGDRDGEYSGFYDSEE